MCLYSFVNRDLILNSINETFINAEAQKKIIGQTVNNSRMKNWAVIFILLILFSCGEDNEPVPAGFTIGATENIFYHANLNEEIYNFETEHFTNRDIDLNNDQINEIMLTSFMDTVYNLETREAIEIRKGLYIVENKNLPVDLDLFVAFDFSDGQIAQFKNGENFRIDANSYAPVDSVIAITYFRKDLFSNQEQFLASWNGTERKFLVLGWATSNETLYTWIELSVADYDDFTLHDFGSILF